MIERTHKKLMKAVKICLLCSIFSLVLLGGSFAEALTVHVVDENGATVEGFRWLLEEDNTHYRTPGTPVTDTADARDSLSLSMHRSYAPVADKGESLFSSAALTVPDVNTRYFLSVLPDSGHAIGGAPVAAGQTEVTVVVNSHPIPTAQISVFIFEDNSPINNAPDLPGESGLAGFDILLEDAGGRYGMSAGHAVMDAFGNPLGTTYNPDGSVNVLGAGVLKTDANGRVLIQNLAPGKYGIQAVPPAGQDWHQTATIEGKNVIDAWVKAGEPAYFQEFGPPGHHVFIGFVHSLNNASVLSGGNAISGRIASLHTSRPPDFTFHAGQPVPDCWIGLNDLTAGEGTGVYAQPCNADSTFSINNVPPGSYTLAIWDKPLDYVFASLGITVEADGSCTLAGGTTSPDCSLGDVPVFAWFGRLENTVFFDENGNGFRDAGEEGILEQAVNIRWRDGTMYQSLPTDLSGEAPLEEVFPFFHWLVAEVDFARYKATGVTVTVDAGGPTGGSELNPQPQPDINPNTGDNLSRTEAGEVLTQAFQLFLGQTNRLEWGKANYGPGENGGITGIVYYATTRAEDDPQFAAAEPWEPGIPRVQINLYQDTDMDGVIDDLNGDGCPTPADVDNYPFGNFPGSEDIKYELDTLTMEPCDYIETGSGAFSPGDAIQITTTDSWDDNMPTGCVGEPGIQQPFYVYGDPAIHAQDCFEGLRTFNQVRDGVFDGGYALNSYFPGGIYSGSAEVNGLPAGSYIVESTLPPKYEDLKSQDRNVDFGDTFQPSTGGDIFALAQAEIVAAPPCVGDSYIVPAELSLFPGVDAPLAGTSQALCNRKQVVVSSGMIGGGFNSVADFFLFTEVPKAARVVGFVLNDQANEFDPNAPAFGEKDAPPWIPVSFHDYKGAEISRVYTDQWGKYNALLPSTYTANLPMPSGMSPNMLTACINSPGPVEDPDNPGTFIIDPFFQRQYTQFCYTFQYMPGTTTYLDTPVLPIAAFAGADQAPLDCEFPEGTPVIYSVSGPLNGPYVQEAGQQIEILSAGSVDVPNPAFDGTNERTIQRSYGFGPFVPGESKVTLGGVELTGVSWADGAISGSVPAFLPDGEYQLMITRGDNGLSTFMGVTVIVGGPPPITVASGGSIQDAIDVAADGDLILVAPGLYDELVIMWKDVKLQGWGALSTTINAAKVPAEKLQNWRNKMDLVIGNPLASPFLLPGQNGGFDPLGNEPLLFGQEEGPGIIVLGKNGDASRGRIDGLTVTGGDTGGGIFVNGYTNGFNISNNRVIANQGNLGGGIRVGHPYTGDQSVPIDAQNDNINIHHNHVTQNGSLSGAGGGVALYTGADGYEVEENYICGNYSAGDGGGIGHLGLSNNGLIAHNKVLFNQSFNQGTSVSGGGVFIGGFPAAGGEAVGPGAGSVILDSNLIQGNLAGAGDGGGVRTQFVNGLDVQESPDDYGPWYEVLVYNNIIVNNVTGLAGGAISLQDTARVRIINNTIANNDSTATASLAFAAGPSVSVAQPAGIVSRAHSAGLLSVIETGAEIYFSSYSNPLLVNDIILHNRSFYWDVTENGGTGGLLPGTPAYQDLAVLGTAVAELLDPAFCLLTDAAPYDPSNATGDPGFITEYFNGSQGYLIIPETGTALETVPAFDEGGNFIDVRFGPLSPMGNYHITGVSAALNSGTASGMVPARDYDTEERPDPFTASVDIGADEYYDPSGVNPSPDVAGPVSSGISADPDPTEGAGSAVLTALISDSATGNSTISAAEWWTGSDPGEGGGNPMAAQDGTYDAASEVTADTIDVSTWADGDYDVHVRGQDANGNWGEARVYVITVSSLPVPDTTGPVAYAVTASPNPTGGAGSIILAAVASDTQTGNSVISAAEWWIGPDPGEGGGNPMAAQDGTYDAAAEVVVDVIDISSWADGDYTINVRSMDENYWGASSSTLLTVSQPVVEPSTTGIIYQCPTDTDGDGVSDDPEVVCMHLVAGDGFINMADGYLQYIFGFDNVTQLPGVNPYDALQVMNAGMLAANLSAPTIEVREGQKLYLTVTNVGMQMRPDLFDPHTVHWHGFANASSIFDGVPDVSIAVSQLASFTYFYVAAKPGTYMYHCHVEATEHMQMGMYGNLWVKPAQDGTPIIYVGNNREYTKFAYNDGDGSTGYDAAYPVLISSIDPEFHDASVNVQPLPFADMKDTYGLINGRGYPDTTNPAALTPPPENGEKPSQIVSSLITAGQGETILLHISNLSVTRYFTVTVLGIPMKVVGKDASELKSSSGEKLHYYTNSIEVGGGNTYDALLYTDDVAPGRYFLYTTNLNYLSNNTEDFGGIMTEIVINP